MPDEEHEDRFGLLDEVEAEVGEAAYTSLSTAKLVIAFAAGLAAAAVAGVVWGYLVKTTDYEIGIAAWGVGLLAGLAVLAASRGARAVPLQVIAVASALVGILVGKYMSFALVVNDEVPEVGVLSSEMREVFMDELDAVFGLYDVLWIGLAVFTAWKVTRPEAHAPAA